MPSAKYDDDHPNTDIDSCDESYESRDKHYSEVNRDYYPTKISGKIVNAYTGEKYTYNQGSYDELRLYRMIDVRGVYDEHGCKIARHAEANRSPMFLYYDSPEQCMRHQGIKIPAERVNKWHAEKLRLFTPNGSFIKDEWEKLKKETYQRSNQRS